MSRPKPNVLLEYINPKTYKADQVLEAEAIYAVFYQGKPINLRILNTILNYPPAKYVRVSFSNIGHAHNLAEKLNKTFKTTDFKVFKLIAGEEVSE